MSKKIRLVGGENYSFFDGKEYIVFKNHKDEITGKISYGSIREVTDKVAEKLLSIKATGTLHNQTVEIPMFEEVKEVTSSADSKK